jgi:aryl-alcohol dehydrogenase-like predicted oxidoreductase
VETKVLESINQVASRIGLGTWAIGGWMWGGTDEKAAVRTIHAALDAGINVIDTAPAYGFGKSEEIVGRAIAEYGQRDGIIVATKVGIEWDDNGVRRNGSRARIFKEIDDSLRRLQTDYIDIYQVHWPDPKVSLSETADALGELYRREKIRGIGVSNHSPLQMDEFRQVAPIQTAQPPYNIFETDMDKDVFPYCKNNDIAILAYGALCRGLLSGKMSEKRQFHGDDLRKIDPKFQKPRYAKYLEAAARLDEFARERYQRRVIHLALRWILDQGVDIALWGARRPDQLEPLNEIEGWSISADDREEIRQIVDEIIDDPVGPEFMAPPE